MEIYRSIHDTPWGPIAMMSTAIGICWLSLPGQPRWPFSSHLKRWFSTQQEDFGSHRIQWEATVGMEDTSGGKIGIVDGLKVHEPYHAQVMEYLSGTRQEFEVSLDLRGTPFQLAVWEALSRVPYGATITYAELAVASGRPRASRAVGNAVGKNPVALIIPCHRVIRSGGMIGGFAGGPEIKRRLLDLEHQ